MSIDNQPGAAGESRRRSMLAVPALLALVVALFLVEAHARHVLMPTPARQGDQAAYLSYARRMHETNYAFVGTRDRMPGYPFLLSFIYKPGIDDAEFLRRARVFNINLSAGVLLVLFFIYRRHFSGLYAAALVAGAAFGVLYYRAPMVQTEVLFYLLSFGMFLAFWRLLSKPGWTAALAAGLLTGFAHLLKASVLPAVALFCVSFGAKFLWELRQRRRTDGHSVWRQPAMAAVVLLSFLAIIFPYLQTSKRVFGSYFYNVSSTFYVWTDSWGEAKAFSVAARDRVGRPAVPPEQIPSAGKYWREHSVAQIAGRIGRGVVGRLTAGIRWDGYYKYVVLLAGTAAVLAIHRGDAFLTLLRPRIPLAVFLACFFAGYIVLFGWYEPISPDLRFLLMLYLPFTFAASKLIARLSEGVVVRVGARRVPVFAALTCVLFVFATADATLNAARLIQRKVSSQTRSSS
jgi:hypothetical protein